MSDDRMDELLREGIRDYNEPGPTPREEMWARIQAGRSQRDNVGIAAPTRSSRRLWVWPSMGVAAAVLVAAGIVIGRRMERAASGPAQAVTRTAQAPTPATNRATPDTTQGVPPNDSASAPVERSASASASARHASQTDASTATVAQGSVPNLAYRLVVLQHLAGTEAMITSFRATAERGETDTLMTAWSRELLGTTRMLAASPAGDDPVMKHLLQDLDFVITEIVQYSAHGVNNPEELKLIEQSINARSVIPKLRGTIPSRAPSAGT